MRAGDRFTFRAVVADAEGCPTGTRPVWSIASGPLAAKASVGAGGTLAVAADAGEGKLEVSVSVGGKGVTVIVEIASPEHYDALLGASGLNDAGEGDQASVAVIAAGTIGGRTAVAEDAARARKVVFVTIVGGLAVALGFVGLVIARRGRRRDEPEEALDPDPSPPSESEAPEGAAPASPADPSPVAARPPRKVDRGKICPTCGDRYGGEAIFCGKDGTTLVLLN